MKPIDKIEWRENRAKEEQLLEYVSLLEQIYIPDFDYDYDDPREYGFTSVKKSDVSPEEWEAMENQPFIVGISDVLQTLAKRYNEGAITQYFNYDSYMKNELIQNFIKDLELDADKFWFLILFIYDYSWHYCMDGIDAEDSPYEQLMKFITTVVECVERGDDPKQGVTFNPPIKLQLSIEGKKKDIIIDNPTAIHYIASACWETIKKDDNIERCSVMNHKEKLETSTPIHDSAYIYYFAMMFLNFFNMQPNIVSKRRKGANYSTKEKDLVCQLIAFTRISTKDCWKKTDNETLKSFLRQYKDLNVSRTINSIYPSVRM